MSMTSLASEEEHLLRLLGDSLNDETSPASVGTAVLDSIEALAFAIDVLNRADDDPHGLHAEQLNRMVLRLAIVGADVVRTLDKEDLAMKAAKETATQ